MIASPDGRAARQRGDDWATSAATSSRPPRAAAARAGGGAWSPRRWRWSRSRSPLVLVVARQRRTAAQLDERPARGACGQGHALRGAAQTPLRPGPQRDAAAGLEALHRAGADPRVPRARRGAGRRALPRALRDAARLPAARWTGSTSTATRPSPSKQVEKAWYHGGTLPPKPVVLSFDDGYRPQFTFALPELRKHGWAGLLNLKAEGSDLYTSNVEAMIAAGWELAAHTIHHLDLTDLDAAQLKEEVAGSRAILRREYGVPVTNFCYPAGRFDATVIAAVEAAGYVGATTEIPGYAERREALRTGPLRDPRLHRRLRPRRRPARLEA